YVGIGGHSVRRQNAVRFIEVLNERCSSLPESNQEKAEKPRDYFIRFGALLKIMQEIESEYSLGIRSPENSHLYKEIQRVTNINHTSELSFELKEADLAELDTLIC